MSDVTTVLQSIVDSIGEQIADLGPSPLDRVQLGAVVVDVTNLQVLTQAEPAATKDLVSAMLATLTDVAAGTKGLGDLGGVLANLDTLGAVIAEGAAHDLVSTILTRVTKLLSYRPDVEAILGDLQAIKGLRGGPADATAFHDFHVLQMAFKNVWVHAFDGKLRTLAADLYDEATKVYKDAGATMPDFGTIDDIDALHEFIRAVRSGTSAATPPIPPTVGTFLPKVVASWRLLDYTQQVAILAYATELSAAASKNKPVTVTRLKQIQDSVENMLANPQGRVTKVERLLSELAQALSEPYAFDVFATDSYNYGLLLTYRQTWTPGEYQAGDLRATVPLAPGETRKYTKKTSVKTSRTQREIERSVSTTSLQTSDTQRAETSIMHKTDTATNFKMTADGSYNMGVASIHASTELATSQAAESVSNKKDFRESTVKAAQEYRAERSLEVDTTSSVDVEDTIAGEISNPNNEITVTYLFYELQRRYKLAEVLYRIRPVILVAQWVPSPHQVDEAFLIEYQWILARVLLDDSLRSALSYLSTGYAGDEVGLEVIRAQWEQLKATARLLEGQLDKQLQIRNTYRDQVAELSYETAQAKSVDDNIGLLAKFGEALVGNFTGGAVDMIAAQEKYTEALLQNVNDNVSDLQNKLKQTTDALQAATAKYADALQKQFSRTVAIDQLRIHVKQNIIYYMQAIWAHEPPDQRFFRLYKKQVVCPAPETHCKVSAQGKKGKNGNFSVKVNVHECEPQLGVTKDLVEIADLDNPLGFKGNYLIFPLKQPCYLTTYMMTEFIGENYGLKDPDRFGTWRGQAVEDIARQVAAELAAMENAADRQKLSQDFADFVNETQGGLDEIIVPTGQLFIEALPGAHPLLEDFKLLHRAEDVRKVKAEVRHAELENLRLATRLVASQADAKNAAMLEDPDIEKKIVVAASADVKTGP